MCVSVCVCGGEGYTTVSVCVWRGRLHDCVCVCGGGGYWLRFGFLARAPS